MINSPRSLTACQQLGVEPEELYQLTPDKFKSKYPELINATEKVFQMRFEAAEKFREETIKEVKEGTQEAVREDYIKKVEEIINDVKAR